MRVKEIKGEKAFWGKIGECGRSWEGRNITISKLNLKNFKLKNKTKRNLTVEIGEEVS